MKRFTLVLALVPVFAFGQSWDVGADAANWLKENTGGKLQLNAESRGRYEYREGQTFGKDPDLFTGLYRNRLSLTARPVSWIKFSGMVQDARSPWYGDNAPSNIREGVDLQEGYVELFPDAKRGFGMTVGRQMVNYGEARLIGSPQWGNLARTWDVGRVYYRDGWMKLEGMVLSPVKIRIGEYNVPVLGERIWGFYGSLLKVAGGRQVEGYVLRHDQNRPGGYTGGSKKLGTDVVGVNTFGGRMTGALAAGVKFSLEGALQSGAVGPATMRSGAWFSGLSRRWKVHGKSLDVSGEYKYASGTDNPADTTRTGTFDQLYPANHDKFGHEDLLGWRNIHNTRSLATYGITKSVSLNVMYNSSWLASVRDSLYNGSGKALFRSANGTAGRHVGQELDVFTVVKRGHFQFGGGYGHFFQGEFIRNVTLRRSPVYLYVFHSYTI